MSAACGARWGTTRASRLVLMNRFSATAWITQSHWASLGRSSSKLPTVMSEVRDGSKKAAGWPWPARRGRQSKAVALRAFTFWNEIQQQRRIPALAKWAAMREPIVPAPSTAAPRNRAAGRWGPGRKLGRKLEPGNSCHAGSLLLLDHLMELYDSVWAGTAPGCQIGRRSREIANKTVTRVEELSMIAEQIQTMPQISPLQI